MKDTKIAILLELLPKESHKMSESEINKLLDLGYILLHKWCEYIPNGIISMSDYVITEKGKQFLKTFNSSK